MQPLRILITRRLPPPAADLLVQAGLAADQIETDDAPARAIFLDRLAGSAGVITTVTERVDDVALDAAGTALRVVANYAVGYDNIDLAACARRGVRVTNTPGVLTAATADLTWALILAAARRVVEGDALVRSGRWPGITPTQLLGMELAGATLGVVGAGRIGAAVARRASGFEMRVIYASHRQSDELERHTAATRVTLEQLLAESDVVTVHVPLRPENRRLIGAAQLAAMKPTAILINTARGPIVDEAALVEALRNGRIAAAGLDVYEHEPRLSPGLVDLPNAVLLPHIGSATHTARQRMSRMAADNVIAVLGGREPLNPVG